jgi:hypothetical protein
VKLKLGILSALMGLSVLAQMPARASVVKPDLAAMVQLQVKPNGAHHVIFGVRNVDIFFAWLAHRQPTLGVQYFQWVDYGYTGGWKLVSDDTLFQWTPSSILAPGWSDSTWMEFQLQHPTHYVRYYLQLDNDDNPSNDRAITPITYTP